MDNTSIIIPARNEPFLQNTIDDLFQKATGKIEVIACLDGYWPDPPLSPQKGLVILHFPEVIGMRECINAGARIASGKYLMKCDGHCMFGEGFDEILSSSCERDWAMIPSRYSLDGDKWERGTKGPIDYLTLTYPYNTDDLYGTGFHAKKWRGEGGLTGSFWHLERERSHIPIDEILTFQGSCWFMHKDKFFELELMDSDHYNFHQEAQEIGFKFWLSGGKVMRNKNTWYAHLHKGKKYGRGFRLSKRLMVESEMFSTDLWMNNKWKGQIHDLKWLIDRFWPLEGWPDDWWDKKYAENYHHPREDLLDGR
jgi:glycosyltransferase involved in cell wall biosynthesis